MSVENDRGFNPEAYKRLMAGGAKDLSSLTDLDQAARKKELKALRKEIISAPRRMREITKKQLALMHGDTFIGESDLAGSTASCMLTYWKDLLEDWKSGESLVDAGLSSKEVDAILLDIEDAIAACEMIENSESDKLISFLYNKLKERGRCVIPISYIGKKGLGSGHVFTAVFELKGENITCQLLNRGDGIECHPIVDLIDGKARYSYCSDKFIIPFKHFKEPTRSGIYFWDTLSKYATIPPETLNKEYCSKELYSYFYILADKVIPNSNRQAYAATPQRGGSCTEKVPELIIRHYLHCHTKNESAVLKRRKRVLFATRFDSLLDAYHDLDLKNDTQNYFVLKNSLRGFAKLISDLHQRNFITNKELHLATALAKEVRTKLKDHETSTHLGLEVPDLDHETYTVVESRVEPLLECQHTPTKAPHSPESLPNIPLNLEADTFKETLDEWAIFAKLERKRDQERAFEFSYRAIGSLPIPGQSKDDFWDAIPEEDIPRILTSLQDLTLVCLQYLQAQGKNKYSVPDNPATPQERRNDKHKDNTLAHYDLLTTLSAFSVAHKLCSRLEKLKLDGYGIEIQVFDALTKKPYFFFSLGAETTRYLEIQDYFIGLKNEKGKLFAIPNFVPKRQSYDTSPCHNLRVSYWPINLLEALDDMQKGSKDVNKKSFDHHLKYLLQFIDKKCEAKDLVKLWQKKMGDEYYILEHFAGLAQFKREHPLKKHWIKDHSINLKFIEGSIEFSWESDEPSHPFGHEFYTSTSPSVDGCSQAQCHFSTSGLSGGLFSPQLRFRFPHENNLSLAENTQKEKEGRWENRADLQDFLKIHYTKNSSIKMSSLINWMAANISKLRLEEIQHEILGQLFHPPHLATAISEEPCLANQLREILDEAIAYYQSKKNGDQTALFWIRTAYLVETHFLEFNKVENCDLRIQALQGQVSALLEDAKTSQELLYEAALTEIYLHRHKHKLSDKDLMKVLSAWLETSFSKPMAEENRRNKLYWLECEAKQLLSTHENLIRFHLKTDDFARGCFAKIGDRFGIPAEATWKREYPIFTSDKVSIDIVDRQVLVGNGTLIHNWTTIIGKGATDAPIVDRFKKEAYLQDDTPFYYNKETGELWSQDRSVHIFLHTYDGEVQGTKWVLEKEFEVNGVKRLYQLLEPGQTFDSLLDSPDYQIWRSRDPEIPKGLIYHGEKRQYFATITFKKEQRYGPSTLILNRLDQQGKETGEVFASHLARHFKTVKLGPYEMKVEEKEPHLEELLSFLTSLSLDRSKIFDCQVWSKDGQISSIVIDKLDLEFTYTVDEKRLESTSFPGYYLDQVGFHSFLSLESALVLKNDLRETKILLPEWKFKTQDEKGASYALDITRSEQTKYFEFDVDEKQELLVQRDPAANLYLLTQLVSSGDFENGARYLDRLNSLQFYDPIRERRIIKNFVEASTSYHPIRSALIVKLAIHYIQNRNLRIARWYQNRPEPEAMDRLWLGILKHATFILQANLLREHGHLPHYLSVNRANLSTINELVHLSSDVTLKIFNARVQLLHALHAQDASTMHIRDNWELVVQSDFTNYTYYIDNKPLNSNILHPSPFVIKESFGSLYNSFVQDDDFQVSQMRLVSLNYSVQNSDEITAYLVSLLNKVIHHRKSFKHIPNLRYDYDLDEEKDQPLAKIHENAKSLPTRSLLGLSKHWGRKPKEIKHHHTSPSTPSKKTKQKDFRPTEVAEEITFPLEKIAQGIDGEEAVGFFKPPREAAYQEDIPFALEDAILKPKTSLEQSIFEDLKKGHDANIQRKVHFYDLKDETTLEEVANALQDQIIEDEKAALRLREQIETAANWKINKKEKLSAKELIEADKHRLKKYWQQRAKMDFARHILPAYMMQDPSLLKKHNPFLSEDQIQFIFNQITDYMLIMSRIDQAEEAIDKIKKRESIQVVGEVLHKKRLYDPRKYPEFLIYEYASGFVLRDNQVELLKWILKEQDPTKRKELLVEFQAGGGKTKVISAILIFIAYKQGKLPVFYSLPSLHDITKDDLRSALGSIFNLKLAVLEFRLTTKLSYEELNGILNDLKRWKREGYALQITPEVYHALYLNYQFALRAQDENRTNVTRKIHHFFLTHGYFIVDEAHRNTTALWQANLTTGDAIPLPKDEQDLFVMCYKALTGNLPEVEVLVDEDNRVVHELLGITSNQQAKLLPKDLPKVLRALAIWICEYNGVEPTEEIVNYLITKKNPIPEIISNMKRTEEGRTADLLFLARGLLTEVLPITLSLVGSFDHGNSIRENDDIESPRYGKAPSSSQFESAEIAAALCNQGLYQRGISIKQMGKLFEKLILRNDQKDKGAEVLVTKWTQGKGIVIDLNNLDIKDRAEMTRIVKALGKDPQVIEYYLRHHLLPQIKTFAIKLISTAPALVDGGVNTILVSATIGRKEEYPKTDDQKGDLPFQAAVVQRALSRNENSELHWVETTSPKALYEHLYEENPSDFDNCKVEGMIDVGGMNIRYSTEEVAEQFLDFAKEKKLGYFGALYIQEETGSAEDKQQLTLIRQDTRERIVLTGSDLYKALKDKGIEEPETLKFFKVYGPTQCTGTDLKLTPGAKMLLPFSESTSLWTLIQAIMRMRGFIKPLDPTHEEEPTQSLVFVGQKKLKRKLSSDSTGEITPKSVIMYTLFQEALSTEERIVAHAFQQIAHEYRRMIDQKLMKDKYYYQQNDLYKTHIRAFEEKYKRRLKKLFGNPETMRETKEVLEEFSEGYRKAARIRLVDWKANKRGQKVVAQVIADTKALVPKIHQKNDLAGTSTSDHVGEQKAQQIGEAVDENRAKKLNLNQDYENLEVLPLKNYATKECAVTSPSLTDARKSANKTFKTDLFSNELYLLPDALQTVKERDFLKHFEYLLVVFEDGKRYVYLTSRHDAEIYQQQLISEEGRNCPLNRKVALFTAQGLLAQNGRGNLAIPAKKVQEIRKSLWLRKICTDIALLNGKIYDYPFFERQISEWICEEGDEDAFNKLFNHLLTIQGTPEEADISAIDDYLNLTTYGRTNIFTEEELEQIESPEFGITASQEVGITTPQEMSDEEESSHTSEEEEIIIPVTQNVTQTPPTLPKTPTVVTPTSSTQTKPKRRRPLRPKVVVVQESSSSDEEIDFVEPTAAKRNIHFIPIVAGSLLVITAIALALITGGWGAAVYFAPIHMANVWIYVSLGSGGGLSLLLFTGGSGLTLTGCLTS